MAKEYKLKTIKEIEELITKENVECFKADFCHWLDILADVKVINKIVSELMVVKLGGDFTWIDDGENNATIRIKVE